MLHTPLYACHIGRGGDSGQSIPNMAYTTFDFLDTAKEYYNHGSMFSSSDSTHFTIKKDGLYQIIFRGYWTGNPTGSVRYMKIVKNHMYPLGETQIDPSSSNFYIYLTCVTVANLLKDEVVHFEVLQTSGNNLDFYSNYPKAGASFVLLHTI